MRIFASGTVRAFQAVEGGLVVVVGKVGSPKIREPDWVGTKTIPSR